MMDTPRQPTGSGAWIWHIEMTRHEVDLEDRLETAGLAFDERPYKPHLTLLRNTRCTTQVPLDPILWDIEEFVLAGSSTTDHGPSYQLLGRWPLKA